MKKIIIVSLLLLAGAGKVEAQCPPNSGIAPNPTNYVLLMPSDVTGVVTTIVAQVSNVSGGLPSHNLTITGNANASLATQVTISWNSANGSTAVLQAFLNGAPYGQPTNEPLNGSMGFIAYSSWNGNTIGWKITVTDPNGKTTQDRIAVSVVPGTTPTIVNQDEIPTNFYDEATVSFSGTSNMACGPCQQNPQACSNVTHQPSISFSLSNLTSGETQTQPTIYGQPVNPTFNNGMTSNPLYLSVLPNDTPQDTQTDDVDCSLMGLFYNQGPTNPGGYTTKMMKTKIKVLQQGSTTGGVTRWYVESWCIDQQHTPIWEPEYIDTKGAATILISEGQYEMSYQNCKAKPGMPAWDCPPIAVTPPQPLTIGVGGTKYDCSTLINTPLPQ